MTRTKLRALLALAALGSGLLAPLARAAGRTVLVVNDLVASGVDAKDAAAITDLVRGRLVQQRKFTVVERSQMEQLAKEVEFQATGCTDVGCAVELGQMLNADKILVGSVAELMGKLVVSARIVDLAQAKVEFEEKVSTKADPDELMAAVDALSDRLAARVPLVVTLKAVDGTTGWLDAGSLDGLAAGQRLAVHRLEVIRDAKGQPVMETAREVGELEVVAVNPGTAQARVTGGELRADDFLRVAGVSLAAPPPVASAGAPAPAPGSTGAAQAVTGTLVVLTQPPGQTVLVDEQPLGTPTPVSIALSIGAHTVAVSYRGERIARDVKVPIEEKLVVELDLEGEVRERVARREREEAEQRRKAEEEAIRKRLEVSLGIEMVLVRGGTFEMGDVFGDGDADEKPVHTVTVTDFRLGRTEVTQAQYQAVMGSNPSRFQGAVRPVERVSWDDVEEFLKRLNERTGVRYRLPTEAEWEYAARSGGKREKWAGTSHEGEVGEYAWYSYNSGGQTHPVGRRQPNGLGLHDMNGNVGEWCSGWYGAYSASPQRDPTGPRAGSGRVFRGGGWDDASRRVRSVYRINYAPGDHGANLGFRLAADR